MPWRVLTILFAALCLPWGIALMGSLFSASGHLAESHRVDEREQWFEAVGVMRRTGKPVIALLHLSNAQNLNLGYPFGTVVPREEVSFDPLAVQRALSQADKHFWTYGGEQFVEVRVLDANADGQPDVLFQYDEDTLREPTRHRVYLYTVSDNMPKLLFASPGEVSPMRPVQLPDGTYAFVNARTVWQGKAFQWRDGRYQLLDYHAPRRKRQLLGNRVREMRWTGFLGLAPAGLLLVAWGRHLQERLQRGKRVTAWDGFAPLLWLGVVGGAVLFGRPVYPHLYHPAFVGLLILFLPPWLAALGAAIAQAVTAVLDRGAGRS